jgi:predicted HicB family RNase H-like nuclease
MQYKGYFARVEYSEEDQAFIGHLAGINDIIGFHADTVKDLKEAFEESVDDYIDACAKLGKEAEKPYSGKVMFRVPPEVHARAALAAQVSGKSLNQWAEEALRTAAERDLKGA